MKICHGRTHQNGITNKGGEPPAKSPNRKEKRKTEKKKRITRKLGGWNWESLTKRFVNLQNKR